jgi:surfeit locus 1 family protein
LSEVSGVAFAPIVLLQTDSSEQSDFVQQWPKPSVDADKNVGYAIQWFGFAAIAFIAICVLLIRATRRAKIALN